MLFPHGGSGRKAKLIKDLWERKGQVFLMFVERQTSKSRKVHEPFEDIQVVGSK